MSKSVSIIVTLPLLILSSGLSFGAELVVQISTADGSEHRIEYREASSHFHVVLTNTSAKPLKIWADSNSWGYDALSFRLTRDGQALEAKKPPANFTRNVPKSITLAVGRAHVIDVYFADPKQWTGFALPANGEAQVGLCADFNVKASEEALKYGVWTGSISSECLTVTLARWKR